MSGRRPGRGYGRGAFVLYALSYRMAWCCVPAYRSVPAVTAISERDPYLASLRGRQRSRMRMRCVLGFAGWPVCVAVFGCDPCSALPGKVLSWLFLGVARTWLRGEPAGVAISGNESIPAVMQQFMADCEGCIAAAATSSCLRHGEGWFCPSMPYSCNSCVPTACLM